MSVVHVDGEERNAPSRTTKRGNVFHPYATTEGAPKIDFDLSEPFINHMHHLSQMDGTKWIGRTLNLTALTVT